MGVKRFARAVRGHWGIENTCHWVLDMTYREDESRIRTEALRENFAWLNRFTLSLLKQHPGRDSLAIKRRGCGRNENFLLEVLADNHLECWPWLILVFASPVPGLSRDAVPRPGIKPPLPLGSSAIRRFRFGLTWVAFRHDSADG
jgi:hypothetical protein